EGDSIRARNVTGVQTYALPISTRRPGCPPHSGAFAPGSWPPERPPPPKRAPSAPTRPGPPDCRTARHTPRCWLPAPCPAGRCPPLPACTGRPLVPTNAGYSDVPARSLLARSCAGRNAVFGFGFLDGLKDPFLIAIFPKSAHLPV